MDFEYNKITKHIDDRGFLIEFLKGSELANNKKEFAQIYCATLKPRAVRGNHYHKEKNEWLAVIAGKVKLTVKDIFTGEIREIVLDSGEEYITRVRIGFNVAHVIENISGSVAVIVAYTTDEYNSKNSDQWKHEVK